MIPPEDRLYQTQYFAEIFPSPLALTLQIHFYLHLQESAYNAFWIVITVKVQPLVHPKVHLKLLSILETTYVMLFLKS